MQYLILLLTEKFKQSLLVSANKHFDLGEEVNVKNFLAEKNHCIFHKIASMTAIKTFYADVVLSKHQSIIKFILL